MTAKRAWTHRVMEIREQAAGFVETLKASGASAQELAVVLVGIVSDLERESHKSKRV